MSAGSGPSAGLRPRGSPQRSYGGARRLVRAPAPGGVGRCATVWDVASHARLPLPGESVDAPRVRRAPPARPRPPGGVGRRRPRRRRRRRPSPAPGGSRIGDVTSARIVRGGLARIEPGRIPSRWARTVRGGVDRVALGSHYASPPRPAPFRGRGPAAPVRESGRQAGADAGRARAGPGPVRVSCTPSRA